MNLPNALTVFRMLLIPLFVRLFYLGEFSWALAVFLLAGATDWLDGFLARRYDQITRFGKLMDPLADKLMLIAALYCLADGGYIPVWTVVFVCVKELCMVVGAALLLKRKIVVAADLSGKAATFSFILAMFALFPWHAWDWLRMTGTVLLYLSLALSAAALVHYALGYWKQRGHA